MAEFLPRLMDQMNIMWQKMVLLSGPFKAGDPQIADFVPKDADDKSEAAFLAKYKPYITKSGEKYLITFAGKKYGPYARIDNFTVSKSKDKFAAMATETVVVTEDQKAIKWKRQ